MESDWRRSPTVIEYWPEGIDYIMGMDESGTSDLVSISRKVNNGKEKEIDFTMRDFTLTGVIVDKNRYDVLKQSINNVKYKYWENGLAEYKGIEKRVCFHSRDIRKRNHPFNKVDQKEFTESISEMIKSVKAKIIACHIDKLAHYKKYVTPTHPYHLATQFILERFCRGLNATEKKGIIILESRGKKEDQFVLDYIVNLIRKGSNQNPSIHFRNIEGVYFNPKWSNGNNSKASFVILEYADLVCFPIHKQHRDSDLSKGNPAYEIVERKLYKYPKHIGWGLKLWPKK
jgi:hypothetical protein